MSAFRCAFAFADGFCYRFASFVGLRRGEVLIYATEKGVSSLTPLAVDVKTFVILIKLISNSELSCSTKVSRLLLTRRLEIFILSQELVFQEWRSLKTIFTGRFVFTNFKLCGKLGLIPQFFKWCTQTMVPLNPLLRITAQTRRY